MAYSYTDKKRIRKDFGKREMPGPVRAGLARFAA
jgi:hypothetical protein